jgi:beta-galactosidase/beta-glucuronidase
MSWQPRPEKIITRWAAAVEPENTWREYPRPQLSRSDWLNLNGLWDYWITDRLDTSRIKQRGMILVPFPIESALSGVKRPLAADELLWYQRPFILPDEWDGKRILLHCEAVDWETSILVNDQLVGNHTGGYLPFSFDITRYVARAQVQNQLMLSVWDPTDTHWQQRGKQTLKPQGIWYSAVSGVWQTIWLEAVPETYISGLKITPDIDTQTVRVRANLVGSDVRANLVHARIYDAATCISEGQTDDATQEITIQLPNPKLWSPETPHLYDLEVSAGVDKVRSYFAMRKFSLEGGRLCLNGAPYFQFGPLDQGYWPDGLYTPPSDEAMRRDIELVKNLGFNMLRKHVKVEPRRYYYYCDKLGLIVWQDMPNGAKAVSETVSILTMVFSSHRRDRNYRYSGREKTVSRHDFMRELQEMVDHLYNVPCIGVWVPFNEGWGQFDASHIARWLAKHDPTRLVDHASGWFDQKGGDCKSIHMYKLRLPLVKPETRRAVVLSEFGGYSLKVINHLWNPEAEFGYKKFDTVQALTDAYLDLLETQLKPWIKAGLSAAIYTQTTDVESEVNGFMTYDRQVEKMDFSRLRQAHQELLQAQSTGTE